MSKSVIDLAQAKDINVVDGKICPFRSTSHVVPSPQGFGIAEFAAPCRRDCAIFDREKNECSIKATGKPPLGLV